MKLRFCPKCKNKEIIMAIPDAFSASMGSHPGWKCNKCGFELPEFPKKEISDGKRYKKDYGYQFGTAEKNGQLTKLKKFIKKGKPEKK